MGKAAKERLNRTLNSHLNTIHETLQVLDQKPASSLEKVSWDEVIKMGDLVSKQATMAGMLWTGAMPEAKALEENMTAYFNILQGFLLLSHGSTLGAGPTLSSSIHASVKQVVDCSFKLFMFSVSSYGSQSKDQSLSIPQLVGAVWEACSALKKTPATNVIAIGRAMTQVAASVKDVLREMKELKLDPSNAVDEDAVDASTAVKIQPHDDDNSTDGDLGNDLSPEEMKIAQLATGVVSEMLVVFKELIRSILSLIKLETPDDSGNFVDSLENILKNCQGLGVQIDELGACIYPPQEIPVIKAISKEIYRIINELQVENESLIRTSESFTQACNGLKNAVRALESELDFFTTSDIESRMENILFES